MDSFVFVSCDKNDGKALKSFDLYAIIIVAAEYVRLLLLCIAFRSAFYACGTQRAK